MEYESIGYVIILPVLCTFGIFGNITTLIVLFKEKFQGVAYSYLKAIAALDLMSLVFVFLTVTRCSNCVLRDSHFGPFFEAYLYVFIGDVFVKSSFWTVLIFTAERCITSCFSTSALSLFIQRRVWGGREGGVMGNTFNQRHSVTASVAVVVVVAAIENSPRFWNYSIEDDEVVRRDIVEQHAFFKFYTWFDAVVMCLIPSVALIVLNAILIKFLRRRDRRPSAPSAFVVAGSGPSAELRPHQVSASQPVPVTHTTRRSKREQTRILVTLVGIIILMLATILPIFVLNLVGQDARFFSHEFLNSRITISILLAVNCSGNFVLYCMLNPRFWGLFKTTFALDRCNRTSCCCCYCCFCRCSSSAHQPATQIIVTRVAPTHFHHHHQQLQRLSVSQPYDQALENNTNLGTQATTSGINTGTTTLQTASVTHNTHGTDSAKLRLEAPSPKQKRSKLCSRPRTREMLPAESTPDRRFYQLVLRVINDLRSSQPSSSTLSRQDATSQPLSGKDMRPEEDGEREKL
ncbi:peptide receptor GPCR [Elysia marginata]|uniref:Peptide receptor GPCR n=1 Tax=Elysia marginata TaxID=1093978 RepID=A0AAV4I6K1_9GAST|nr:peptide receptor GPCR [Elysia marginata]